MPIRKDTDELIAFLNQLLVLDRAAITALIGWRVPCTTALTEHPTVQVGPDKDGFMQVGLLGVLNGYCGKFDDGPQEGWGPITALIEPDGDVVKFVHTDTGEESGQANSQHQTIPGHGPFGAFCADQYYEAIREEQFYAFWRCLRNWFKRMTGMK